MKHLYSRILVYFFTFVVFCTPLSFGAHRELTQNEHLAGLAPVSLIRIIVQPKEFNGKWIAVRGLLSTGYEDSRLYLTEEHARHLLSENSIEVEFDSKRLVLEPKQLRKPEDCHYKYVLIYGKFDSTRQCLTGVTRLVRAGTP